MSVHYVTTVSRPGYLPDSADDPGVIPADLLADDLRAEWSRSLDSLDSQREAAGNPLTPDQVQRIEEDGRAEAERIDRLAADGVETAAGLPDGMVWEAVRVR